MRGFDGHEYHEHWADRMYIVRIHRNHRMSSTQVQVSTPCRFGPGEDDGLMTIGREDLRDSKGPMFTTTRSKEW